MKDSNLAFLTKAHGKKYMTYLALTVIKKCYVHNCRRIVPGERRRFSERFGKIRNIFCMFPLLPHIDFSEIDFQRK